MTDPQIDTVEIVTTTFAGLPGQSMVHATFSDGTNGHVFSYFADELTFTEKELIGLTRTQARDLHRRKDIEWLQT